MMEIRCKNCGRLLGKFQGTGEVKCPKTSCKGKNVFNTKTGKVVFIPITHVNLKDRATSSGVTFH